MELEPWGTTLASPPQSSTPTPLCAERELVFLVCLGGVLRGVLVQVLLCAIGGGSLGHALLAFHNCANFSVLYTVYTYAVVAWLEGSIGAHSL